MGIDDTLIEGILSSREDEELRKLHEEIVELNRQLLEKWNKFSQRMSKHLPMDEEERRVLTIASAMLYMILTISSKYEDREIELGLTLIGVASRPKVIECVNRALWKLKQEDEDE